MLEAYKEVIITRRLGNSKESEMGAVRTSSEKAESLKVEVLSSNVHMVNAGDKLLIAKYSGTAVTYKGEDVVFIREEDILASIIGRDDA